MDINVIGQGEKSYKPDQIVLDINISNVYKNYEEALVKGEQNVLEFLNEMKHFGFEFQNFKTVNYQIRDEIERKDNAYKRVGIRYIRGLTLKLDYDMKKVSEIVEFSSKLNNAPRISLGYGLKDIKTAEMQLFADAYQNAKRQADIIANAADLKVVKCAKTSIGEENNYYCKTGHESTQCSLASACASDIMVQTYTPQDIIIKLKISCVFIAE